MGRLFFILLTVLILLFFPIYLQTRLYYDVNGRKFAFSVCLYRIFRLIGGYVATYKGGIAIHKSNKKALLIPYSEMDKERKRFSVIKTFKLKSFILTTEVGAEYLLPAIATHSVLRTLFFLKGGNKEEIRNNLWLTDGNVLKISLNSVLFFNLFIILRNFIIFLKEQIPKWLKKTKN